MANTFPFADLFKNNFDYNQLLATPRRNTETATALTQLFVENAQAMASRQVEVIRENVEVALKSSKDLFTSGTPELNVAKQANLAKDMFESALSNLRETVEMATKSGFEAFDLINRRAAEGMEEISKATGAAAPASKKKSAA